MTGTVAMTGTPRPSIGLALGAGASRGWAHIGVIRRLAEAGIVPDIVCGTSAGALVGGFHAASRLDVLEEWARNLTFGRLLDYTTVRRNRTLFGKKILRSLAELSRGAVLEKMAVRFAAVATDLETGREAWIRTGSLAKAVAASNAFPGLLAPVKVGQRRLVDGALVNPVPVSACRALGARFVIAVGLSGSQGTHRVSVRGNMHPEDQELPAPSFSEDGCEQTLPDPEGGTDGASRSLDCRSGRRGGLLDSLRTLWAARRRASRRSDRGDVRITLRSVPLFGADQPETAIAAGRAAAEKALFALAAMGIGSIPAGA